MYRLPGSADSTMPFRPLRMNELWPFTICQISWSDAMAANCTDLTACNAVRQAAVSEALHNHFQHAYLVLRQMQKDAQPSRAIARTSHLHGAVQAEQVQHSQRMPTHGTPPVEATVTPQCRSRH